VLRTVCTATNSKIKRKKKTLLRTDECVNDAIVTVQLGPQEVVAPDSEFENDYITLLPPHPTVQLAVPDDDLMSVDLQRNHIDQLHKIAGMYVISIIITNNTSSCISFLCAICYVMSLLEQKIIST
jgi:hypothetical protein